MIYFPQTQLASLWETILKTPVKTPMDEGTLTPIKIKQTQSVFQLFTPALEKLLETKVSFEGVYPVNEFHKPTDKFYGFRGDLQLGSLTLSLQFMSQHFPIGKKTVREYGKGVRNKMLTRVLGTMEMEVTAVIGQCEMTVDDLTKLSLGDIIILDEPGDEPLQIKVAGVTKFRGISGVVKGQVCCQIKEVLDNPPTAPKRKP